VVVVSLRRGLAMLGNRGDSSSSSSSIDSEKRKKRVNYP
jgi:hypothetical protein